jgi:hypothetical protein
MVPETPQVVGGNVLTLLPAKARQVVYIAFGLLALVDSATLVGYGALARELPDWLVVATAVITFLALPIGSLAAGNVTRDAGETHSS